MTERQFEQAVRAWRHSMEKQLKQEIHAGNWYGLLLIVKPKEEGRT